MNNNKILPDSLANLICCPQCGTPGNQGFDAHQLQCNQCQTRFFSVGKIPCLFPSGEHQLLIWQHQAAVLKHMAEQALESIRQSLARFDISDKTRDRLAELYKANLVNLDSITHLLQQKGIPAVPNEGLAQAQLGDLSEYFDLVFRDWAWDSPNQPNEENKSALERVNHFLKELQPRPLRVLVLGAGAGRLSWDLHQVLAPEFTLSLDSNPLLLALQDELINNHQSLEFGEFKLFPQFDRPISALRTLTPPDKTDKDNSWVAMGANAWQLPLVAASVDLVITPWFIDVVGGDLRDLIGIINRVLVPGGHWINTGPLLFTRHLPLQLKYTIEEIKELLALSGFDVQGETIDVVKHIASPLEARGREEQVWTFLAQKNAQNTATIPGVLADWLVMHHLPIPPLTYAGQEPTPLIDVVLKLADGNNSVNDICQLLQPHIPEGLAVKEVVIAVLGQILTEAEQQ